MVTRMLDQDGILSKIFYEEVVRIVRAEKLPPAERFFVPEALLGEKVWRDRTLMQHYGSSPRPGK